MSEENQSVRRAIRIYESLQCLYPQRHRQEYGPLMVQFFRDQCRDACRRGNRGPLLALWLGTLVDLACSAFREQLIEQTNRMKNNPPKNLPASALQGELAKTGEVMSERDRKVAQIAFVIVAALYVLLAAGFLLNVLQREPFTERQKWLGASASLLIPVICWSWGHVARFLPAFPARRKRLALVVLSTIAGSLCTMALLHFVPATVGEPRGAHGGTVVWAFLPLVIGITLIFGLEEAAYRKLASPAHS